MGRWTKWTDRRDELESATGVCVLFFENAPTLQLRTFLSQFLGY